MKETDKVSLELCNREKTWCAVRRLTTMSIKRNVLFAKGPAVFTRVPVIWDGISLNRRRLWANRLNRQIVPSTRKLFLCF
jgi:hypothetical protein